MTTPKLSQLEEVDVREIWPDEARDFTPWLAENLPTLSEALALRLELIGSEESVGDFSADIVAEVDQGFVVIENQLAKTDHGHLGQLLTYAAGKEARVLIWVTPEIREEHRAALEWLNRFTLDEIAVFGVEVRAVRIGDSDPAPEFRPIVAPNGWQRRQQRQRRATSTSQTDWAGSYGDLYQGFFQPVIDALRDKDLTDRRRSYRYYTQHFPSQSGLPNVEYALAFLPREGGLASVHAFIRTKGGVNSEVVYESLVADKEQIERALGGTWSWEPRSNWCAVRMIRPGHIVESPPDDLANIRDWMIDLLPKFMSEIEPRLRTVARQLDAEDAVGVESGLGDDGAD